MSEEVNVQETEGTSNVGDQVSKVVTYDSATEDDAVEGGEDSPSFDVAGEEHKLSTEEIELASVTASEISESKGVERTGTEPVVKKPTSNDPVCVELENAETLEAELLAATSAKVDVIVVDEKSVEDKDSIKLNEAAMPSEPVSPLSKEMGTKKMSQEPELLSLSLFENSVPSGAEDEMIIDEGLKQTVGEGIGKDDKKAVHSVCDNLADCVRCVYADHDSINDANEDNEESEESDQEFYMQALVMVGKERQESQIFIGGLGKGAVEDDLVKVFKAFGDIQSVRIVKHTTTKKSKGFAFISFSSDEHAMRALTELKDGIEVNGKRVRVLTSHDNAKLYLGNISKTWTRDHVIGTLKSFGVEQMEGMILPADLKIEGTIKDLLQLCLCVALRAPLHPSQEVLLQIKTACIEGIPLSWDEEKVLEICKEYGQIEKVLLLRNLSFNKRKDFGFVKFSSHESAVASVEGINNAQLGDGDTKIRASLSKPLIKDRLTKQDDRSASMIKKDGEANQDVGRKKKKKKKKKKKVKSKGVERKEEMPLKLKNITETVSSESNIKGSNAVPGSQKVKSVKRKKGSGNLMEAALRGSSKKLKTH